MLSRSRACDRVEMKNGLGTFQEVAGVATGFKIGWRSHWTLSLKHGMTCFCFVMCVLPHLWHTEVPRVGIDSELYPDMATPDPGHMCTLRRSMQQPWILRPLREARERPCLLTETASGP